MTKDQPDRAEQNEEEDDGKDDDGAEDEDQGEEEEEEEAKKKTAGLTKKDMAFDRQWNEEFQSIMDKVSLSPSFLLPIFLQSQPHNSQKGSCELDPFRHQQAV